MKRVVISLLAVVALLNVGCSSKNELTISQEACEIEDVTAPKWVCGLDIEESSEALYSVGSAPLSELGQGFSRKEALADARGNLAQQVEVLVKDKVERFNRSTHIATGEVADKVALHVSKQVAKVTLSGSKAKAYWQHPKTKELYVLVSVPLEGINQASKDQLLSSYKNNEALWEQFEAKKAIKELDREFQTSQESRDIQNKGKQ